MRMIGIIAACAALASCATITRGQHEAFTVNTTPSGAHVSTSLGLSCDQTPCTFPGVAHNASFSVTITKAGYKTWTGQVTHQTAGGGAAGMAGNIILGGLIGAAVDAGSGATQQLVPNPLNVTLEVDAPVAAVATTAAAPQAAAAAMAPAAVSAGAHAPTSTAAAPATTSAAASTSSQPAPARAPAAAPSAPH
jgi:hypothetical protein